MSCPDAEGDCKFPDMPVAGGLMPTTALRILTDDDVGGESVGVESLLPLSCRWFPLGFLTTLGSNFADSCFNLANSFNTSTPNINLAVVKNTS
jgi:hypothetical protein